MQYQRALKKYRYILFFKTLWQLSLGLVNWTLYPCHKIQHFLFLLQDTSMDDSGISEQNVNAMMNGMDIGSTSQHNSVANHSSHDEADSTQATSK